MPSKSLRQHNFMAMVANDPKAAKRTGVPKSVGEEYMKADKGKTFSGRKSRADLQKANRPKTNQGKSELFAEGGAVKKEPKQMIKKETDFMKKKGAPKSMIKHEKAEAKAMGYARGGGVESKGKTHGKIVTMRKGGCM